MLGWRTRIGGRARGPRSSRLYRMAPMAYRSSSPASIRPHPPAHRRTRGDEDRTRAYVGSPGPARTLAAVNPGGRGVAFTAQATQRSRGANPVRPHRVSPGTTRPHGAQAVLAALHHLRVRSSPRNTLSGSISALGKAYGRRRLKSSAIAAGRRREHLDESEARTTRPRGRRADRRRRPSSARAPDYRIIECSNGPGQPVVSSNQASLGGRSAGRCGESSADRSA